MTRHAHRFGGLGDLPADILPRPEDRTPTRAPDLRLRAEARDVVRRGKFLVFGRNIGATSQKILAANDKRAYLLIQNNGTANVFVGLGNKATSASVRILPGGSYEFPVAPIDSVHLIAAVAGQSCAIVEATEMVTQERL